MKKRIVDRQESMKKKLRFFPMKNRIFFALASWPIVAWNGVGFEFIDISIWYRARSARFYWHKTLPVAPSLLTLRCTRRWICSRVMCIWFSLSVRGRAARQRVGRRHLHFIDCLIAERLCSMARFIRRFTYRRPLNSRRGHPFNAPEHPETRQNSLKLATTR